MLSLFYGPTLTSVHDFQKKKHSLLNRVLINNIFLANLTELLLKSCDTMYVKVPSTAMKAEKTMIIIYTLDIQSEK